MSRDREPKLPESHPLSPLVAQLGAMVAGLRRSPELEDADGFLAGKVDGIESALVLVRRAGANLPLDIEFPAVESEDLATRVAKLEARMGRLEEPGRLRVGAKEPPALTAILRDPPLNLERAMNEGISPVRPPASDALGGCERTLLRVLAQRRGVNTSVLQLALLSSYSNKSSGFKHAVGKLRTAGLAKGGADRIAATPEGLARVGPVPSLPKGDALFDYWLTHLPRAEGRIFRVLREHGPLESAALAEASEYSELSSGFKRAVGRLRTLELVEKGWPAQIADPLRKGGR